LDQLHAGSPQSPLSSSLSISINVPFQFIRFDIFIICILPLVVEFIGGGEEEGGGECGGDREVEEEDLCKVGGEESGEWVGDNKGGGGWIDFCAVVDVTRGDCGGDREEKEEEVEEEAADEREGADEEEACINLSTAVAYPLAYANLTLLFSGFDVNGRFVLS
jgi:hypothetical protein